MGVKHINKYCLQIGAFEKVDMIQDIREYRSRTGKSPVLIIDGVSFMYSMMHRIKLPWLTGGSLQLFQVKLNDFLTKLLSNGAEIIIFFDGCNSTVNCETWVQRRFDDIRKHYMLFDKLNMKQTIEEVLKIDKDKLYPGMWETTMHLFAEHKCKIVKAVYECDAEIAAFARNHECLGIIADDTDFFINCSCNVYTCYYMSDITSGIFFVRRRDTFLHHLKLDEEMLPLLASLLGNDVIDSNEEGSVVRALLNKRRYNADSIIIRYFANYIRHLNISGPITTEILNKISLDIYNDPKKAGQLKKSIDSYCTTEETIEEHLNKNLLRGNGVWKKILQRALKYHKYSPGSSKIFYILANNLFEKTTCVEDFREKDFPPVQLVLRPLRQKLYGILLYEKPGQIFVTETIVINDYEIKPVDVKPIPPKVLHPGLMTLWDLKHKEYNWALLGDALDVDSIKVQKLPESIIVPALVMRYLKDKIEVKKWEIRAFVLSAVIVLYSKASLSEIHYRKISSRGIRFFTLITETISQIRLLIESLGNIVPLEKTLPSNYLDGMLFHLIYNTMEIGVTASKILHLGYGCFLESRSMELYLIRDSPEIFIGYFLRTSDSKDPMWAAFNTFLERAGYSCHIPGLVTIRAIQGICESTFHKVLNFIYED